MLFTHGTVNAVVMASMQNSDGTISAISRPSRNVGSERPKNVSVAPNDLHMPVRWKRCNDDDGSNDVTPAS